MARGKNRRRHPKKPTLVPATGARHGPLIPLAIGLLLVAFGTLVILRWPRHEPIANVRPSTPVPSEELPAIVLDVEGLSTEEHTTLLREKAVELAHRLVRDFPQDAEAHMLQGNTLRQLGRSTQAVACWEKALALTPRRADAYTYLAILSEEKGETTQALAYWEKVLALEPNHAGVRDSLAHTLIGLNRGEAAISHLREALTLSPQSARTHYLLGQAHLRDERFGEAIDYFEKAIDLDPNLSQAYYELATALVRSGRRQEARLYQTEFQKRNESQRKKDLYGFSAEDDLRKARQSLSNLATAAAGLYQAAGQSLIGLGLLQQAVALDPGNLEKRKTLAARYRGLGQLQEALGQCEQIAILSPNDPTSQMLIGSLSLQLQHYPQAESAFQRMISVSPNQAYGYRELARLHLTTNENLIQAQTWARQAVTLEPSAPNYYVLGLVCQRNGDVPAALQALQQALRKDPGNRAYREAYQQVTMGR